MALSLNLPFFFPFAIITQFLFFSFPASAIFSNNETDRLALLEFKSKISHDPFGVMTSWNSSLHFCQWYGVQCGRRHQRVTALDLRSLKLSGSISPHIGNLSFLRDLILLNNSFSHEIPPQIGYLRRLQRLILGNNVISGRIPVSVANCSNLIYIFLTNNYIAGEIPVKLSSLQKLQRIALGKNSLMGTLPPSFGNLSSLQEISANDNILYGVIPETLGQLMNLKILAVSQNRFSGTFPCLIFNISSLQVLDVGDNQLQGKLPFGVGTSLPNLQFFSVGLNRFTGTIPFSISNASNLQLLQLAESNFTGTVPSLEKLHQLEELAIFGNHLGSGNSDDLKFVSTLANATNLRSLLIAKNNFGGQLPEHMSNFSKKLYAIDIALNQISGQIPGRMDALVNLQVLYMNSNKLSGIIPSSIGKLQNLQILKIDQNHFTGSIPSSLGNLTNSIIFDLSKNSLQGAIPSSLGNCTRLLYLDLHENSLSGPILSQVVGGLSSLSITLDLSGNHLSNSIPIEIGNLKNIGTIDLQNNMLSGEIPSSLGSCTSLEFLYVGANLFQGSIPSSLSSLRGIQELNLSQNNFSGKIPEFFKEFRSIKLLDISYNDFEGVVPIDGVFSNASRTLVAGNKNLCGGIHDFGLPECKFEQSKRRLTVKLKIIIPSVLLFIVATFVLISIFLCHSRKRKGESAALKSGRDSLLTLSYQSLLKATNGFSSDNVIGTGSFGSVYKGILEQEGTFIAVKVLNLMRRGASKSFIAECEALRHIRHRNLVKVLTACSGIDYGGYDFKALVYEFMVNGSLDGWLHPSPESGERSKNLNVRQRLNIAIDVASALEYLHHYSGTPIVHCDLKPSNVLLNEEMTAIVSDFGLAKFLSNETIDFSTNQSVSIGVRGTIGYCPPEYGMGSEVSTQGDIFSFGILLLEMFTGKRPTDDMFNNGLSLHGFVKRALAQSLVEIIDPNLLEMEINATSNLSSNRIKECLLSIFEIGISCSAESPQERMNIGDVVAQLSSIRSKLQATQQEVANVH